jgi:hypothetical protein
MTVEKGVNTTHAGYTKYSTKWKRCRDVVAGQDAVHLARTEYLPKLKDQTDDDYSAYVKRAGFYNASWRTISGLLGMMFRKPPKIEVPAGIVDYLSDVTMAGMTFDTFARMTAGEVLEAGRFGILIDHPPAENVASLTVDVAQKLGLRPTMQAYHAESIINWKYRRVRNRHVLSMVVLKECVMEADGEFAEKEKTQYRVLDLDESDTYRMRVFEVVDGKDVLLSERVPVMNGNPLGYIPFAIVGTDGIDSDLDEPPLIDLVDLNLSHYRTNADYEHGCHFTGLPTAVVSGYVPAQEGEKLYIGSQAAWVFPDPNAKATFLEFTGQGLSALKDNLDRKEQQMAVLGARMLAAEKRQAETATTAAIHRTGENSILSSIAIAVSEALQWALGVFAQWAGQPGEVEYEINRDFLPAMMDAPTLTALMGAWQSGALSEGELFDLLQRADMIESTKTLEEHQAEVEISGPPAPAKTEEAA